MWGGCAGAALEPGWHMQQGKVLRRCCGTLAVLVTGVGRVIVTDYGLRRIVEGGYERTDEYYIRALCPVPMHAFQRGMCCPNRRASKCTVAGCGLAKMSEIRMRNRLEHGK